jgi:hypothetical protein
MRAVYNLAAIFTSRQRPVSSMTSLKTGGPVLRVPRANFSGMRENQRPQQQQQQHYQASLPHWPSRSRSSQQYDRFKGRDEQDLKVQEFEVDGDDESYERRSQEYAARQVSYTAALAVVYLHCVRQLCCLSR